MAIVPVGFSNGENVVRNLRRVAQIENITHSLKKKLNGHINPSQAKKEKKKHARTRFLRERAKRNSRT